MNDFTPLCLHCDTVIDHDVSNICNSEKCRIEHIELLTRFTKNKGEVE